jgi:hypothetical protein
MEILKIVPLPTFARTIFHVKTAGLVSIGGRLFVLLEISGISTMKRTIEREICLTFTPYNNFE